MIKPREWFIEKPALEGAYTMAYPEESLAKNGAIHVIEKSHYDELKAKHEELLSYLPKVPTEPYETRLARETMELRAELAALKDTPGGKRLYGALNEIDRLKAELERMQNAALASYKLSETYAQKLEQNNSYLSVRNDELKDLKQENLTLWEEIELLRKRCLGG